MKKEVNKSAMLQQTRRYAAQKQNSRRLGQRRKKNHVISYTLATILILVVGITLSLTVFFNIQSINIEGAQVSKQEVSNLTGIQEGDNLFRISLHGAEEKLLESVVEADRVTVSKHMPNAVDVTFEVGEVVAVLYSNEQYYSISEGGRIVGISPILAESRRGTLFSGVDLSHYQLGDFLGQEMALSTYMTVLDELQTAQMTEINQMQVDEKGDITLNYNDCITILLGTTSELDYKLQIVKKVMAEYLETTEEGIIDAQIPSVAYFRPMTVKAQKEEGIFLDIMAPAVDDTVVDGTTGQDGNGEEDGDQTATDGTDEGADEGASEGESAE